MDRNDRLRSARESTPSPTLPGEPMSRVELADAVNAELWRTTGHRSGLDAHTIGRYERGVIRWPGAAYRSALRSVLGVFSDADLGFAPTTRGPLARPPAVDPDRSTATSRPLTRVGWSDVEQVRATVSALAASENLHGGGLMYEAAGAQLRWSKALLHAQAREDVRAALHEAVGNLAAVVAFSAFDVRDHPAADRCFQFALTCADEAGSWALRSNTLADMSRKAAYLGDWDEALSLSEFAQVRSDRVSATARAMMSMLRSRYLTASGRCAEGMDELSRADEWIASRDRSMDPPWLCYYDAAEHQGSTARNLRMMARSTGDPRPALDRLALAIELSGDRYPRSRVFSRIRLAALLMETGDVQSAVEIGHQVVGEVERFRSGRMRAELVGLGQLSRSCGARGPAADLAAQIEAT